MEYLQILFGILSFIVVLWWDVATDVHKWRKDIPINHTKEAIIRCILLIPSLMLLLNNDPLYKIPVILGMQGAWWWEFFDGFYNKLRGFSWRFNGSHDPDDSKLDKFLYHLTRRKQAYLKWSLIILFTTLYIIL